MVTNSLLKSECFQHAHLDPAVITPLHRTVVAQQLGQIALAARAPPPISTSQNVARCRIVGHKVKPV